MKMMCKYFLKPVDFDNKKVKILVIENNELLRNTIMELYHNNENELLFFSDNYEPISYSKKVRFIGDILNFNFNDKKLISKLYTDLERSCNEKYFDEIILIKEKLYSLCENLSKDFDFDIEYELDIETTSILKICAFKPKDDTEDILEKLLRYFKLMKTYIGIDFFIVQNLYLYHSNTKVEELFQTLMLNEIYLVDIEHFCPSEKTSYADIVIIDKDLCFVDK